MTVINIELSQLEVDERSSNRMSDDRFKKLASHLEKMAIYSKCKRY